MKNKVLLESLVVKIERLMKFDLRYLNKTLKTHTNVVQMPEGLTVHEIIPAHEELIEKLHFWK